MDEQVKRQWMEFLSDESPGAYGYDRRTAELLVEDDDLWLMDMPLRPAFEPREAVREWEKAARFISSLADIALHHTLGTEAVRYLLYDAEAQAREAH